MVEAQIPHKRITRRTFIRSVLYGTLGVSLGAFGGTYYSVRIEPTWLKTERIRVPIRNLPAALDGYRMVQISDLHIVDEITQHNAIQAVERALSLSPDTIVVTGDYVTGVVLPDLVYPAIQPLTAPDGVWTIMGNHDHWTDVDAVRDIIAGTRIKELRNAAVPIERGGNRFWLAGVDDIWTEFHDLDAALADVPPDAPTILLAHEPDYADQVAPLNRVSLQLSGHSHGGQVRIPIVGAPIVPYLGTKYIRGLNKVGNMYVYTNRGVGTLMYIRFNCRPEVTEITLIRPT